MPSLNTKSHDALVDVSVNVPRSLVKFSTMRASFPSIRYNPITWQVQLSIQRDAVGQVAPGAYAFPHERQHASDAVGCAY